MRRARHCWRAGSRAAAHLLKPRGVLTLIWRADGWRMCWRRWRRLRRHRRAAGAAARRSAGDPRAGARGQRRRRRAGLSARARPQRRARAADRGRGGRAARRTKVDAGGGRGGLGDSPPKFCAICARNCANGGRPGAAACGVRLSSVRCESATTAPISTNNRVSLGSIASFRDRRAGLKCNAISIPRLNNDRLMTVPGHAVTSPVNMCAQAARNRRINIAGELMTNAEYLLHRTLQRPAHRLLPARFRTDIPVVPVVRLSGVIGVSTPAAARPDARRPRPSTLERAFSVRNARAVALLINSPGGSPSQSHLIYPPHPRPVGGEENSGHRLRRGRRRLRRLHAGLRRRRDHLRSILHRRLDRRGRRLVRLCQADGQARRRAAALHLRRAQGDARSVPAGECRTT